MIVIERIVGPAWVQDGGRPGRMHEGVPPGGALVPEWLARANRAVGNADGSAGIERFGALTIRAGRDLAIAEDDGVARMLRAQERIELSWDGSVRARYLAIDGGIDVPVVLGGRGTLLVAGIGGHEGRALRRGDVLPIGRPRAPAPLAPPTPTPTPTPAAPIPLLPGPDASAFAPDALDRLIAASWRISIRSDRTGTRLEGAPIAWRAGAPPARTTPMVAGAIELPPSGEPIVLGPDHPTTGGYPVVAVIPSTALGRFHAIAPGRGVRFTR